MYIYIYTQRNKLVYVYIYTQRNREKNIIPV